MSHHSDAEAFLESVRPYMFQDAHFLVEAQASISAIEFEPNRFRFRDGSVLHIQDHLSRVVCHPPEATPARCCA
ncbi:hypothetical protein HLB44_34790 [Aquincola sp. S2]|uniref:Uncharacterized protein n=1 Tax=Pseudaquabacterium terrae TaxID=2732868 RepID=A0ABX2EUE5_9BURK|nr:hypothetical protein [Aquabacterium terrae]NRF72164.1 hypothetical protein [Aquabacterium terrae]